MMDVMRDQLLTPGEVAKLFRVDPKTVTRWAEAGLLQSLKTPGGHHRFWQSTVITLLNPTCGDNVEPLHALAAWLVSLDSPDAETERRMVTLNKIIERARRALADTAHGKES